MFGPHLMLDCYGCNREKLKDKIFLHRFLDELPVLIGMHKISEPNVVEFSGNPNSFDRGGLCGIILIAESHISVHTFPDNEGHAFIDIFSCKNFDVERAVEHIIKTFEAKRHEKNFLMRGREFPKEIAKAVQIVRRQRKRVKA